MIIGDDRVKTTEVTHVAFSQRCWITANILTIHIARDLCETIKLSLAHKIGFIGEAATSRAEVVATRQVSFLVTKCEEQAILDDRTVQRSAPALFFVSRQRTTIDAVGEKTTIEVGEECRTAEFIATAFGNNVDKTAGEFRIFHIKRREFDRNLVDHIVGKRQRVTRCERCAIQTEDVRLDDAVNGKGVGAVIATQARDTINIVVLLKADARVDADDVTNVACKRRESFQRGSVERYARANRQLYRACTCAGHDDHIVRCTSSGRCQVE